MEQKLKRFISSTVSYHDIEDAITIAHELDCGIEISRFGKLAELDSNFLENKKHYIDVLKDFDKEVTLHGFFSNLNIAAKDPLIAEASLKRYYQSLELAEAFDCTTVVFHTCFNNLLKQEKYREMFFLKNIEFYKEFNKHFEELGINLTIENVHEPNPDFIRNLVAAINAPNFGTTLDIGHCNLHSEMTPSEWIKEYGIMLKHMHFHNNFKNEDSHSSLLKGSLDIKEILKTLKELRLFPTITFEIFDRDELFESVEYFNSLCDELEIPYC